jgi:hypothetical protein
VNSPKNALDTQKSRRYKGAVFATLALLMATPASAQMTEKGAILPSGSRQVGENRYRSPSNYAGTLTFYGRQYKTNPRKTIVNQPGIRAVHLVNDGKGDWEGLNIYELGGETRIFIVLRDKASRSK